MTTSEQKVIPYLWFDHEAQEAAVFYTYVFKSGKIDRITRVGPADVVEFDIGGFNFIGLNGGPAAKFTPAISFLVSFSSIEEVVSTYSGLITGGTALMALDKYPFSEKYAWVQDKYGLSWQLMYIGGGEFRQKITPTLMYVGAQCGKAEAAIELYTSVFPRAKVGDILRYENGEGPDAAGTIKHAAFTLEGLEFAAMDSAYDHRFNFTEAISLLVRCRTQAEIDRFWEHLTMGGGQAGRCGWLKDRFGVSWQVVPDVLSEMLRDPDKEKVGRVTEAFLKMGKFDIDALSKAYQG